MSADITKEKVGMQIEELLNSLPKSMSRAIRMLKSKKGYSDNEILLHLGKMFRTSLITVYINISTLTFFRLFYFVNADSYASRSLEIMNRNMTLDLDLYFYLIFMIVAVINVINAFSIYKTKIIYKHVLDLQEIIEEGERE